MPYSLASRFEGALLGAALGEALGAYAGTMHLVQAALVSSPLRDWHPRLARTLTPSPMSSALIINAQRLIQQGIWQPTQAQLPEAVDSGTALAIATLPMILFHHDNDWLLRQQLLQTAELWQISATARLGWLTISEAIAQALQECKTPFALINQLAASLASDAPEMVVALKRLQGWLDQSISLHNMLSELTAMELEANNRAVILALYCFLQTPTDLPLALLRAAQPQYFPQVVCPLVGAMVGAWGGRGTMPLAWAIELSSGAVWQTSAAALYQLAERLFLVWAGILDTGEGNREAAIAAPGNIRPR